MAIFIGRIYCYHLWVVFMGNIYW